MRRREETTGGSGEVNETRREKKRTEPNEYSVSAVIRRAMMVVRVFWKRVVVWAILNID